MQVMHQLPQLIKAAIESRSTSVIRLASVCGTSRQHIYDVIAGKTTPTLANAELMAKEIGCEIVVKTGRKKQTSRKCVNRA